MRARENEEAGPHLTRNLWHLDLGFLSVRNREKETFVVKPSDLWCFEIAACAKKDSGFNIYLAKL